MSPRKIISIIVVLLMLAGIIIYVVTDDESEPLGEQIESTLPSSE